jgi:hypothetical protein
MEGTMRNYGRAWYWKDVIANIQPLSKLKEESPVWCDSGSGNEFIVTNPDKDVVFKQSPDWLYYHDTGGCVFVMVKTIKENHEGFTICKFT